MGEREWNEVVKGESACSLFRRVNVAVTVRELVENTGAGRSWPNTLRSGLRQGSALRYDERAGGRAPLTAVWGEPHLSEWSGASREQLSGSSAPASMRGSCSS